jgi:hypothetical protein
MKTIQAMVDLIEMGAVHPQDIVKNLRSAIAQTKPLSDDEIKELIVNKVTDYQLCRTIEERHGIK